jgi:hypothetical protein
MKIRSAVLVLIAGVSCFGQTDWKAAVQSTVPLYGHRNWIVIADSAYPEQSAPGIETIVADADQAQVVNFVLETLAHSKHVTPTVYTDQELGFLDEQDAPGISGYRDQLKGILGDRETHNLPHEQIIGRLDQVSRSFRVLIVKTKMTLPYTSVFLQLDCAYWPADAEQRLRQRMKAAKH